MKKGDKGESVKQVQTALLKLGYKIGTDGIFGSGTEAAVKDYQQKKGLTPDGIVGAKTLALLCPSQTAQPAATGKTGGIDPSVVFNPINVHMTKCPTRVPKYLVIHYTAGGNSRSGAAESNRKVFLSRNASADFVVDDTTMIQVNPDIAHNYCWAVGDGDCKGRTMLNSNCVSIEICSNLRKGTTAKYPNHEGWYFTQEALANAVKLSRIIMKTFNIPIERVVRHYDVSGKYCPGIKGWNNGNLNDPVTGTKIGRNDSSEWENFKKRLL